MNPISKKAIINPKAEYIISLNWADKDPNDLDIWVEDPSGNIIWFRNKEAGLVHLDRDDRGNVNDTIDFDGKTIDNPLNQEIVTIRGVVPGEYIVNVHYYETIDQSPVPANITISKVNPILNVAFYGETILQNKGDESTVARFTVDREGDIIDINKLQKSIVIF
jgi:uncharacterized protein YfaP (DUF2135 family)